MARDGTYRWLWIKAVRPVKEIHQHVQRVLLGGLHLFAHSHPHILHPLVVLEPEVLRLELDGVVVLELKHVFENSWDLTEVRRKGARDFGEREVGQWFGEDGGQSRQRQCQRCYAGDEDENGSGVVNVLLDLSCNTLIVELVLLKTASVDQSRGVEDGNLEKRLRVFACSQKPMLTVISSLLLSSLRWAESVWLWLLESFWVW